MAAEDFFARWSKRRQQERDAEPAVSPVGGAADSFSLADTGAGAPTLASAQAPLSDQPAPTLDEVSRLTADSDYSRFVARGVDDSIKRAAMKKLFADPHFNLMDGLDTYIDNYNVFEPIPPAMLHALNHGKALLDPLARLERPLMELIQKITQTEADPGSAAETPTAAAGTLPSQLESESTHTVDPALNAELDTGAARHPAAALPLPQKAAPSTPASAGRGST